MSPDGPSSSILFRNVPAGLDRRGLRTFQRVLQGEVAQDAPFTCLVTNDRELQRLNREFLGRDYATDVLSFPAMHGAGELGELAISAERAREQAAAFGHTIDTEIQILMLHGLLHLMGLDHERDRGRMARIEKDWRQRLALPSGLIERAAK
jgi:probable rRNA maturation factor